MRNRRLSFGWMFFLLVCAGATGRAQTTSATAAERNVQIELNASYESLTHGYAPWRSLSLDVSKKLADRRVLYGSLRETSRFSLRDQEVMGGLYFPLGKRWLAQVPIASHICPTRFAGPKRPKT